MHLCGPSSGRLRFALGLAWHPPLFPQRAALVTVAFSDFRGRKCWHPWPLPKGCVSKFSWREDRADTLGRRILKRLGVSLWLTHWGLSSGIARWALWEAKVGLRIESQFMSARWKPRNLQRKKTDRLYHIQRKIRRRKIEWTINSGNIFETRGKEWLSPNTHSYPQVDLKQEKLKTKNPDKKLGKEGKRAIHNAGHANDR